MSLGKSEMNSIIVLILVIGLLLAITGYVWIKNKDQTVSLEGEVIYSN